MIWSAMIAWIVRLFSGFNILDAARGPERIGKLFFYGAIITVALVVYHKLTAPENRTSINTGGGDVKYYSGEKVQRFGCSMANYGVGLWRVTENKNGGTYAK